MKVFVALLWLSLVMSFAGCDLRSGTAKREMEKFSGTPTPTFAPIPTEAPIDPADVVKVDPNLEGDSISVNGYGQKKSVTCTKLNRVSVNGDGSVVTIKGPCRQIMVNGDGNKITGDATIEIVINGSSNTVQYSCYVNGKRPVIKNDPSGNTIEKIAAPAAAAH